MNRTSGPVDAIFFDFDGVIVDTVHAKERAFREMMTARAPGEIGRIMEYYWANGGVSRLTKFQWIWANIINQPLESDELAELGNEFSLRAVEAVLNSPMVAGAEQFLIKYSSIWACYVISGTPETELRALIERLGLAHHFRGAYGSPPTKVQIGERILSENGYERARTWFVGDATTDRDAAAAMGIRFVGIAGPHLTPYLAGWEAVIDDLTGLADVLTAD